MDRLEVSTDVYLPPADIYEFLVDFPRYAQYSKYLDRVKQYGDGSPGTEYDLVASWWKLSYTARSKVTAVDSPTRIDWEIIKDIHATGHWRIEPMPEAAPEGEETASRVYFSVSFDTSSASRDAIDIPRFVSFDSIVNRVKPKLLEEARRVVGRIVADLEGETREVELRVHETPTSV